MSSTLNTYMTTHTPRPGITHLPDHKFLLLELQRSMINTNLVFNTEFNTYNEMSHRLRNFFDMDEFTSDDITPASNDYTVVLSYFDEIRCFDSLKAWIDYYKEHCKRKGVIPQRLVAIVSDLCYNWPDIGWDTTITNYHGCELLYVNYSNKIYLSNKFNKMHIRSQAWEPDAEQLLFLPGHLINLRHRMELLEKLIAKFGIDKIKYTLNIPDYDDESLWDSYTNWIPQGMHLTEWKDYLMKFATTTGDCEGVSYPKNQSMSGVDMPGEIYNNTIAQVLGRYNHNGLTEKLPRAILNDMPVFFQPQPNLDYQGYMHYDFSEEKLDQLADCIENIRSNPNPTREMLDYNKNLLNTHGEEFYNYLDENLSGKLEILFLEGGLFSHAM
jgi:hypothetical protein